MSREQLIAELQRRGVAVPGDVTTPSDAIATPSATKPSTGNEALLAELQRRGVAVPSEVIPSEATPAPSQTPTPQESRTVGDRIAAVLEPAAAIATGVVAEPLAGLAGIVQGLNPFADEGAAARAVEATREAATFKPMTEAGQQSMQAIGSLLEPVGKALTTTEKAFGDTVFKATGSPTLAAGAATLPTVVLEALGLKGSGRLAKSTKRIKPSEAAVKKSLTEAAPTPDVLKNVSRGIYKELDDSGVQLKPEFFKGLTEEIAKKADKEGLSNLTTPRAFGVLEKIKDDIGKNLPVSRIEEQVRIARKIGKLPDAAEANAANAIADILDNTLDNLSTDNVITGKIPASQIGKKMRAARNLWGRALKGEGIQNAIERAKNSASGFENGLRIEFDKILRSDKKKKFYNKSELSAMNDLVRGDIGQNFAKLIGRVGFGEGRATNVIGGLLGTGVGAGLGGLPGFLAVGVVGGASRKIAQILTKNKAKFIESISKAGKDGKEITKAYLNTVPKKQQTIADLAELLSDPNIDLSGLVASSNKQIKEAMEIAAGRQVFGEIAGAVAATEAAILEKQKQVEQNSINIPDNDFAARITNELAKRSAQ